MTARAACLLVLVAAAPARAADVAKDSATADERTLLATLDAEQYIKARDQAEAILAKAPESFVATWAMALVHHNEEGNHARALYFVVRAEELLARRFGDDSTWLRKILLEEYDVLFEMNRNADALAVLDRHDAVFGPTRAELRIWPLFKLGRADEARAIATRLAASDDWGERARGYNGMLSIEYEAHDREASYRWAVEGIRATQERDCVILRNAAGSAFTRFRLGESEGYALRAHKAEIRDCPHAGYDQLAGLYLVEGEFQKALSAIETLKQERLEKRVRPHFALTRRMILADVLYALGKVDDAERMAGELYGLPERTGLTSSSVTTERIGRSFRYWMALDTRLVEEREKASYGPFFAGVSADAVRLVLTHWELRRALIQLCADSDALVGLVRPNLGDLNDITPWRMGALVDVLGVGVVRAAVARARILDAKFPEAGAYLDALEGEVAFRGGRLAEADRLATAALAHLPREEAMLRWRTQAWQADALRRLGRMSDARPLYQQVMQKLPSALRFLDLRLPVTVEGDASPLARKAAARVARSTRFARGADAPFRVQASGRDGTVELCLTDDRGFQFACAAGERRATEEETLRSALDAFHAAAFSPKVSLNQSDLNSLDGSPVRVGADEALKGVLEP